MPALISMMTNGFMLIALPAVAAEPDTARMLAPSNTLRASTD